MTDNDVFTAFFLCASVMVCLYIAFGMQTKCKAGTKNRIALLERQVKALTEKVDKIERRLRLFWSVADHEADRG
jgi:hypothetical protein